MRKILNLMVRPDFKSKIKIQTFVYLLDFLSHLKRKNSFEEEKIHEKCQEELRVLRDEFERYKSRTNQLMKAKYNKVNLYFIDTKYLKFYFCPLKGTINFK